MNDKSYKGCPFDELETLNPEQLEQSEKVKIRIYKQDLADQLGVDVGDLEVIE